MSQDSTCHDNKLTNVGSDTTFGIQYILPSATCDHQMIQWWWQTSNNCNFASWNAGISDSTFPCNTGSWPNPTLPDCVPGGTKDNGGEQFVNCLDLSLSTNVAPGPELHLRLRLILTMLTGDGLTMDCAPQVVVAARNLERVQIRHLKEQVRVVGSSTRSCNCQDCSGETNVDGDWGDWSTCTKTCGSGTQERLCNNPTPQGNGAPCTGDSIRYCNENDCPTPSPPGQLTNQTHQIHGYVENWVNDYENPDPSRYGAYTALFYSFLTLDPSPNPSSPRDIQWAGDVLYDTMTLSSILDVMASTNVGDAYHWQYKKIKGLMDYCAANGKRFIWALGGWSDLKRTIADSQIPTLVSILVELLRNHGGDGIDFDWEHASMP